MTLKTRLSSFWANNNPFANILPERRQRQKIASETESGLQRRSSIRRASLRRGGPRIPINSVENSHNEGDSQSTTSTLGGESSGSGETVVAIGNNELPPLPGSTIAFGLMSTMAVRPLLDHVAPDAELKQVDVALNEIKTLTTSSVYGLTKDQLSMVDEVQRLLPGHTFIQYIDILEKAKWSVEKATTPRSCKRLKPRDSQALSVSLNEWNSTFLDKVCDESSNKASGGIATTSITSSHHQIARTGSIDSSNYSSGSSAKSKRKAFGASRQYSSIDKDYDF